MAAHPLRGRLTIRTYFGTNKKRVQRAQRIPSIVPAVNPTPPNEALRATLEARSAELIFYGSTWLTADEVVEHGRVQRETLGGWLRERRIFGVDWDGQVLFASYQFGVDQQPLAAVAGVLKILDGYGPRSLAAWFESTSSFLGGRRPRELIGTHPDFVTEAAHDWIESIRFAG